MLGVTGARIYDNREALELACPSESVFEGDGNTYGLWLSGLGVLSDLDRSSSNIRRLVLPNPRSQAVQQLASHANRDLGFPGRITRMTRIARDTLGADVRWCDEFPGTALTFYNPDSKSGWLHLTPLIPGSEPNQQPTIWFKKSRNRKPFRTLWRSYATIWRESRPPNG